ncbi:F-box protein PP2-A13-like [Impatiens glandulifera]|uniref:F-box protein PP2-A13-like n=1 Tax=Impatiens glandulifera TaxID=253017 RepID=UPI001FB0805D|nr:F-box protein PP2-A13-like [Impatiens glandulifera]
MEKKSGKICLSMSWKGMKITGIDDRRYWTHIPTDQSRFRTIAYLQQIWWLEVDGNLEFEFPQGSYSLFFRLRLGRPTTTAAAFAGKRGGRIAAGGEMDRVHGWGNKPVRFKFSTSEGQEAMTQCYLPNEPTGKWICQHVGDFDVVNTNSNSPPATTAIKFSLTQIDCTHTKGGLCLDSLLILPKS